MCIMWINSEVPSFLISQLGLKEWKLFEEKAQKFIKQWVIVLKNSILRRWLNN